MTSAETHVPEPDATASNDAAIAFPVVGIGASAGGLEPLLRFFERMPGDSGMAFVVIVHLSPRHASGLPSLLQRSTPMRVVVPEDTVPIEPDTIYVISPNRMLTMNDGAVQVTDFDRPRGRHVAIDVFFRTLASVHRERAFAVVLSGTGSDGAVGIRRIKEEGGVSLVQLPGEAEFDGMPRAAIATGAIDWVLPVDEMPDKLVQLARNARAIVLPALPEDDRTAAPEAADAQPLAARQAAEALREVLGLLRARTGHDFRSYKRATVLRRIERRLQVNGLPNLPAYRAYLQSEPDEARALLDDLLIGVTHFFRDPEAWDALRSAGIAPLLQGSEDATGGLRAWVPGCATGEEAYSLGMLLTEEAARVAQPPKLHLFATDIDEAAIDVARRGVFPAAIETDVSAARLRRFFERDEAQYRIRKELRERVMFAVHNLLHDPPFSRLDVISCRNLLIYLDRDVHADVLQMFHFALKPGGVLFLGSSESADAAGPRFSVIDKKHRIYRASAVPRATRYLPGVPTAPRATASPADAAAPPTRKGFGEVHRRVMEQQAPASILVDVDGNIVHLSMQAGRFLHHAAGAPSHNLLSLVRSELRLELRTLLFEAMRTGHSVEARRVELHIDGKPRRIAMIAHPVHEPDVSPGTLLFVVFHEIDDSLDTTPTASAPDGAHGAVLAHLEEELKRTREQLHAALEHSETSTEELKASNEELQAINEELRSATEELETSKEELQSINEELVTINLELKVKMEETVKLTDDLQNLIASTDIATLFIDRGMTIKRFTPRATRLFNLIPTDVGRSLLDIRHRLHYDQLADDAAEAFQSLRVIEREVHAESGEWYLARALPYRTGEDRIDGAVLTFVDITSRRRAEHRVRLIADSTRDYAIATLDAEGRITAWNQGAELIFGYHEAEVLGQSIGLLFMPEDRQAGVPEEELRRARQDGRAEDERWHVRKDGTRVYCSGITSPLLDDRQLVGYAKIARDMTVARLREQERERLLHEEAARRAEAQASNEMKAELLAVMSHELKNPLNLIQLNADLLSRLPEARALPGVQRAAGIIRRTVVSQAQIIDDLLDLSRMDTGKLALNRQAVDWSASVAAIVPAMQEEAGVRGVSIDVVAPAEPVVIDADPVRVEQIVWNLLKNAVKFTEDGGRVTVRLAREGTSGRLEVQDTGIGIDAATLPEVFDMFRQAAPGGPRVHGGLGIGLAVVKQMTLLHGGDVAASSEGRGRGACFVVRLPLADDAASAAPAGEGPAYRHVAGRRALIVDDDRASLEALRQVLAQEGMEVVEATDAQGALDVLAAHEVDVLVTDIAMPKVDGYALLRAVRRESRHARLVAFAMSGMTRPVDVRRAVEAGFRAHFAKPIRLDPLLAALDAALAPEGGGAS